MGVVGAEEAEEESRRPTALRAGERSMVVVRTLMDLVEDSSSVPTILSRVLGMHQILYVYHRMTLENLIRVSRLPLVTGSFVQI